MGFTGKLDVMRLKRDFFQQRGVLKLRDKQ